MNTNTLRRNALSLPASIVLTLFMFVTEVFFMLYSASGLAVPAAWLIVILLTYGFFRMVRSGDTSTWRKYLFITGAILFVPSFIAMLLESRGTMFVTNREVFLNETPFCHIVLPMTIVPYILDGVLIFPAKLTAHFASFYAMLIIWFVSTLTIGRGWCSWVCFYGGWDEGCSSVGKKALVTVRDPDKKLRYGGFAILGLVVLASLATFTAVYCTWFCPWKLVTEYEQVTDGSSMLAFILLVLLFFGLAIILPFLTKKRVQCMSFCPFGAFQSFADKLSLFRVRVNPEACTGCMACVKACPTMSIHEDNIKNKTGKVLITCTKCGKCMEVCPTQTIRYERAWTGAKPHTSKFRSFAEKLATAEKSNVLRRFAGRTLLVIHELADPKALVPFSGWLLGSVIMGGFAVGTITRLLNLFINGSFLLK